MAANAAASFADILAAESDYNLPADDKDVRVALDSFGAIFNKRKGDASDATRADLLAGLALLHTHHLNLEPMVKVLTIAQQQTLSTALGLDFQAHGTDATWPSLLGRRIVAKMVPGSTPKKRKPVQAGADGQIRKPGDDGAKADSAGAKDVSAGAADGQPAPKKRKTAKKSKPASDSDSSAAASSGSEGEASSPGSAVVELMPAVLGSGSAFDSLVATVCARPWLRTALMEEDIPSTYLPRLFRARHWTDKQLIAYDKMLRKQKLRRTTRPSQFRREDPNHTAFPHRLKFAYSPDDGPAYDAEPLRLVCAGERLSDWSSAKNLGGTAARSQYKQMLDELATTWADVVGAIQRNEHVAAPTTRLLTETVLNFVERRYSRFALVLPAGRVREEILANIARQLGELRTYFEAFDKSLLDCFARMPYAQQAQWIGKRILTLFSPAVTFILAADGEGGDASSAAPATPAGGSASSSAAPSPAFKSTKSILKSQPAAVSFADGPPPPAYNPYQPVYSPPPAAAPAPSPGPYAPFYPAAMMFADGGGPGRAMHPSYFPSLTGPAYGGAPGGSYPGAYAPPPAPDGAYASRPAAVAVKPEPGQNPSRDGQGRASRDKPFMGQPQHGYVSGLDLAAVPAGQVWRPPCGCAGRAVFAAAPPGLHATWDCPLRYIERFGFCPGFHPDGTKDPAQWAPGGDVLSRASKDKWAELIEKHGLPLPREKGARAPDFRK